MIEVSIRHGFDAAPSIRRRVPAVIDGASRAPDVEVAFASGSRALALFGDSGAGKTTVLHAIAGLLRPSHGRIVLDDRVLFDADAGIDVPTATRRVGYVFQDGRLFPHMSVRANLLYGARSSATGPAGWSHIADLLELGSLLQRRPATLSGGERQRVAIGRALLSSPHILLLDEPLTGLHRDARQQVLDHLRRLKRELRIATVLVSHHTDDVLALADEVVLLHAGRVAGQLPMDQFGARQRD